MNHYVSVPVHDDTVVEALVCGAPAIRYWASRVLLHKQHEPDRVVGIEFVVRDTNVHRSIGRQRLVEALPLMARTCPTQFVRMMSGNVDSTTADFLIQLAAFGELVYG